MDEAWSDYLDAVAAQVHAEAATTRALEAVEAVQIPQGELSGESLSVAARARAAMITALAIELACALQALVSAALWGGWEIEGSQIANARDVLRRWDQRDG